MRPSHRLVLPLALAAFCAGLAQSALAQTRTAPLSGYQEVPALNTPAGGSFTATLQPDAVNYRLSYRGVASGVTQAHIHIGQKGVNGGISVFLCSNLDDPSAGTQACPAGDAEITGTITAASVIGPTTQGIAAGQFDAFLAAARAGVAYVNVHSVTFPGGEIRGQIK